MHLRAQWTADLGSRIWTLIEVKLLLLLLKLHLYEFFCLKSE